MEWNDLIKLTEKNEPKTNISYFISQYIIQFILKNKDKFN